MLRGWLLRSVAGERGGRTRSWSGVTAKASNPPAGGIVGWGLLERPFCGQSVVRSLVVSF